MRYYDFTQPGGFPFSQDILDYLQTSYTEALTGIARLAGEGTSILCGCAVTQSLVSGPSTFDVSVTEGWVYHHATQELIKVEAQTITIDTAFFYPVILFDDNASQLTYNDGSTPYVVFNKKGVLDAFATGDPTPIATIGIYPPDMKPFGRERNWTHMPISHVTAGDINGDIYYKKDTLTNTLLLRGSLTVEDSSPLNPITGPTYYTMDTLPVDYSPAVAPAGVKFIASAVRAGVLPPPQDVPGGNYIRTINCEVDLFGNINIEWLNAVAGATGKYALEFDVQLRLE